MRIKSIQDFKRLKGRRVLLRVDFNVPVVHGKVQEDYRIRAGLETINFLLAQGTSLVIIAHLGDATGKPDPDYSLRPIARCLAALLKKPVKFIPEVIGKKATQAVNNLKPGEIVMLENLRFYPAEAANQTLFAKTLATYGDLYVNDAFAVCHRAQASISAIKRYLPAYAGLWLEKEVRSLEKIRKPKKPLVVIMGGAKISTKAPLIVKLIGRAQRILIGGVLANVFFKFQKWEIGRSLVDADSQEAVRGFYHGSKLTPKIMLPMDVVVQDKQGRVRLTTPQAVQKTEMILDIGPETITRYAREIKLAATLVWNGPMGKFEEASFRQGSLSIARLVAARSQGPAYGLVGGRETITVLGLTKMGEYVDWISTGGGAMLSYLSNVSLPGLTKIIVK